MTVRGVRSMTLREQVTPDPAATPAAGASAS